MQTLFGKDMDGQLMGSVYINKTTRLFHILLLRPVADGGILPACAAIEFDLTLIDGRFSFWASFPRPAHDDGDINVNHSGIFVDENRKDASRTNKQTNKAAAVWSALSEFAWADDLRRLLHTKRQSLLLMTVRPAGRKLLQGRWHHRYVEANSKQFERDRSMTFFLFLNESSTALAGHKMENWERLSSSHLKRERKTSPPGGRSKTRVILSSESWRPRSLLIHPLLLLCHPAAVAHTWSPPLNSWFVYFIAIGSQLVVCLIQDVTCSAVLPKVLSKKLPGSWPITISKMKVVGSLAVIVVAISSVVIGKQLYFFVLFQLLVFNRPALRFTYKLSLFKECCWGKLRMGNQIVCLVWANDWQKEGTLCRLRPGC